MERTVICRKSKKCIWEYIGGEIFLGLLFVIPVILAAALPVEESASYVRYIFAGIGVFFFLFFVAIIVSHVRFTRLPEVFLERANTEFFHSNLDNSDLRIRSVDNIEVKISKDKYGRAYSYGKLTFEVDGRLYVFKKADNPEATKQTITEIKQSLL